MILSLCKYFNALAIHLDTSILSNHSLCKTGLLAQQYPNGPHQILSVLVISCLQYVILSSSVEFKTSRMMKNRDSNGSELAVALLGMI